MLGLRINNYEVLSVIGEGGMGSVYLAHHPFIGRRAAIKVLRPEFAGDPALVARFINEARAVNAIRHPHLIDIIDVGTLADGTPYLMMEFLDGQSLGGLLVKERQLPVPLAIDLMCQAASALAAAHDKDIVHRDLKPDNLFLVPEPTAKFGIHLKVLDFGIAKLTGGLRYSPKTSTGVIMGTPAYMSPEQCRGVTESIDHRSDIYSLGVILFHLVCGRPPFVSDGVGEIMGMHLFADVPKPTGFLPDLPPALEGTILRAMAKAPEARFQRMADFEAALRAVEGPPPDGRRAGARPQASSPKSPEPAARPQPTAPAGTASAERDRAKKAKTTLGGRGPYRALAIGGGLLLLIAAFVGGLVTPRGRNGVSARSEPTKESMERKAPPPAALPPPRVLPEARVAVSISTTPSEADVMNADSGELLGVTPYQMTFPRGDGTLRVVMVKSGYQPVPRTLSLAQNESLDLTLTKERLPGPARSKAKSPSQRDKARIDPDAMRKL